MQNQKNDTVTSSQYLEIRKLIEWLAFDRQRMSQSGQQIYDELCNICQID